MTAEASRRGPEDVCALQKVLKSVQVAIWSDVGQVACGTVPVNGRLEAEARREGRRSMVDTYVQIPRRQGPSATPARGLQKIFHAVNHLFGSTHGEISSQGWVEGAAFHFDTKPEFWYTQEP